MNQFPRNLALWLVIGLIVLVFIQTMKPTNGIDEVDYSDFISMVENGNIMRVEIQGRNLTGLSSQGQGYIKTIAPEDPELIQIAVAFTMILVVLATTFIECEIILKCLG